MTRTITLDRNQKPTKEQLKQIEKASKREIIFDEDSPELTPAMEKAFRLAAKNRNTQKNQTYLNSLFLILRVKLYLSCHIFFENLIEFILINCKA